MDILSIFKEASLRIKIITIYNLICVLLVGFSNFPLNALIAITLLIVNYFLLKGERWAFVLMLIWFAIQSVSIVFRNANLFLHYGPTLYWSWQNTHSYKDTGDISYGLGINFPTLILFFILLSAGKTLRKAG